MSNMTHLTVTEFAQCRVEIEREAGNAGFVVYGPAGQILATVHGHQRRPEP